jgi:hypothetical protein
MKFCNELILISPLDLTLIPKFGDSQKKGTIKIQPTQNNTFKRSKIHFEITFFSFIQR